jgi:hypothetical protein
MKLTCRLISIAVLAMLNLPALAQPTFSIKYHFRLYNEKGFLMTCDSLAKRSLMISTPNSTLEKQSYDTATHYFFVNYQTTLPQLTFIWKHKGEKMYFNINCPTGYKDVYLDSLYFKPGAYSLNNDCQKNVYFENERARYIRFASYAPYKKSSSGGLIYDKMDEIRCKSR